VTARLNSSFRIRGPRHRFPKTQFQRHNGRRKSTCEESAFEKRQFAELSSGSQARLGQHVLGNTSAYSEDALVERAATRRNWLHPINRG